MCTTAVGLGVLATTASLLMEAARRVPLQSATPLRRLPKTSGTKHKVMTGGPLARGATRAWRAHEFATDLSALSRGRSVDAGGPRGTLGRGGCARRCFGRGLSS
jgi:hypothetical protein